MFWKVCSYCGGNLDPGEECTCRTEKYEYHPKFRPVHMKRINGKYIISTYGKKTLVLPTLGLALAVKRTYADANWKTESVDGRKRFTPIPR